MELRRKLREGRRAGFLFVCLLALLCISLLPPVLSGAEKRQASVCQPTKASHTHTGNDTRDSDDI